MCQIIMVSLRMYKSTHEETPRALVAVKQDLSRCGSVPPAAAWLKKSRQSQGKSAWDGSWSMKLSHDKCVSLKRYFGSFWCWQSAPLLPSPVKIECSRKLGLHVAWKMHVDRWRAWKSSKWVCLCPQLWLKISSKAEKVWLDQDK